MDGFIIRKMRENCTVPGEHIGRQRSDQTNYEHYRNEKVSIHY